MLPLALLAGGLATRLRPLTETVPKALIEIAGEPFIAHQLRLLKREKVERVVVCAGYLGEMIEAYVRDGSRFGITVTYSYDGPTLLGTGGSLMKALPQLGDAFFIMYGDSYLDTAFVPVAERFRASGCLGLMTAYRNEGQFDTSNIEFENGAILRYDKGNRTPAMRYIDYGLGILSSKAFAGRPHGVSFDLAGVYADLLTRDELAGFEVTTRFYEIGSHAGIADTDAYLRRHA